MNKKQMRKYIILFFFSLSIYIFHAMYTKHAIYGDGNGYYVTAQSVVYEKTLNSKQILEHLSNFVGRKYIFSRIFWNESINPYPVGTSLIWTPFLILASLLSTNRFDLFHEIFTGSSGIILMLTGLYFLEKYLLNFYKPYIVLISILTIFFGSNVFYYTTLEPALSHQPAFFIICFLLYWTNKFKFSNKNLIIFGLISGLFTTVRLADSVLLIPLLFNLKLNFKRIVLIGFGFLIGITPQLYSQFYYYGNIFINPYLIGSSGHWSANLGHIFEYLFSFKRGLFIWSPIYLVGIYGLYKLKKRIILYSILLLTLIGSFWSAYLSAGFGQRLIFSATPFFAIGIADIYKKITLKNRSWLSFFFISWNIFMLIGFYLLQWKNVP